MVVTVVDPAGILVEQGVNTSPIEAADPNRDVLTLLDEARFNLTADIVPMAQYDNGLVFDRYGAVQGPISGSAPSFSRELLQPLGGIGVAGVLPEGSFDTTVQVRLLSPVIKPEQCPRPSDVSNPNKVAISIEATTRTEGTGSRAYAYRGLRLPPVDFPELPN